jgi:hypothetical protein
VSLAIAARAKAFVYTSLKMDPFFSTLVSLVASSAYACVMFSFSTFLKMHSGYARL